MIMGGWKPSSWKLNRGIRRVDGEGEKEHEKLQEQALSDIYHLHMVISQVVKDLKRKCDGGGGGGGDPCLEPLNIFNHMWKYRGEGNANVVVALQNDQRVIRLSKVGVGEPIRDLTRHRRKVEREVIFANKVFGPLIGPEFVGSVKAIQLDPQQILKLNDMLQSIRPAHRLHKELRVPYATSHSDFARIHRLSSNKGSDFCVEIKPKQGWWPGAIRDNHLHENSSSCSALCTYCMNQFLKLKRSKISSRTWYCPLDLFSGNAERMIEAITALIANPQNNFRIFCNGKLVFGEYNEESLETVLNEWMSKSDNGDSSSSTEMPSALNSFIYLLCVSLLKPKYIPDPTSPRHDDSFSVITRQLRKSLAQTPPSQLYAKILAKSPATGNNLNSELVNPTSTSCNRETSSTLPEGCILSRILETQKLADIHTRKTSIYNVFQKVCPVHSGSGVLPPEIIIPSLPLPPHHHPFTSSKSSGEGEDSDNIDSGNETERLSDSESFEDGFDSSCSSSTTEEDTVTTLINLDVVTNPCQSSGLCGVSTGMEDEVTCPSSACLSVEKWLDEIDYMTQLTEEEVMAVEMYLLAATAKDCSIMITFNSQKDCEEGIEDLMSKGENEENKENDETIGGLNLGESNHKTTGDHHQTTSRYENTDLLIKDLLSASNNMVHRVRIGVADLDPKPLTTIVRHYLRDYEMLQAYNAYYV